MLGHYLLTLTEEQEDRVLTTAMLPGDYTAPCLVGVALGDSVATWSSGQFYCNRRWPCDWASWLGTTAGQCRSVEDCFDQLHQRFGAPRVNAAIRNRILSNRARRILQNAPVSRDTEVATQSVGACRFGRGESKEIAND